MVIDGDNGNGAQATSASICIRERECTVGECPQMILGVE